MEELQMIEEIKAETRMFKWINLKSTFIILGFALMGFILRSSVYEPLEIPFIVFNITVGFVFSVKSPWNREKMIWQSLLLYVRNLFPSKNIYHAVEFDCYEKDEISESKLMYTSKYAVRGDEN